MSNKIPQNRTRKLKIYCKHVNRSGRSVFHPEIRLTGKWLQELGFKSGDEVELHCEDGKITITAQRAKRSHYERCL